MGLLVVGLLVETSALHRNEPLDGPVKGSGRLLADRGLVIWIDGLMDVTDCNQGVRGRADLWCLSNLLCKPLPATAQCTLAAYTMAQARPMRLRQAAPAWWPEAWWPEAVA